MRRKVRGARCQQSIGHGVQEEVERLRFPRTPRTPGVPARAGLEQVANHARIGVATGAVVAEVRLQQMKSLYALIGPQRPGEPPEAQVRLAHQDHARQRLGRCQPPAAAVYAQSLRHGDEAQAVVGIGEAQAIRVPEHLAQSGRCERFEIGDVPGHLVGGGCRHEELHGDATRFDCVTLESRRDQRQPFDRRRWLKDHLAVAVGDAATRPGNEPPAWRLDSQINGVEISRRLVAPDVRANHRQPSHRRHQGHIVGVEQSGFGAKVGRAAAGCVDCIEMCEGRIRDPVRLH